tara:strand:- start:70302 stop:71003 length:702 start_codon:yes stop_codon:yes gene_type:complete
MNEVKLNPVYANIPDAIAWICQQRLQNSNRTYQEIWEFIHQDQALKILLPRIFEKNHLGGDLKAQMSSYGVKGIRDRLASLFLYQLSEKNQAKSVDLTYILEVQQFEERFSEFANEWDSRIFLLGFYLRVKDLKNEEYNDPEEYELNIPLDVDEILTHGKAKIEKLDWLIITLKSLLQFKSKDELIDWINKDGKDIYNLIITLSPAQQKVFLKDLLQYGHAINDLDFFIFNKI